MKFPRGRWAFDARTLLVIVVVCGAMVWVAGIVIDGAFPVRYWSRRLRNGDAEQRRAAVEHLKEIEAGQVPAALPALAVALRDLDEKVASATAVALGQASRTALRNGDADSARRAVTALTAALSDARPEVRASAVLGLVFADEEAGSLGVTAAEARSDALAAILSDDREDRVRSAAAWSLGRVGVGESGLRALIKALNDDPYVGVRHTAAHSLGGYRSGVGQATLALLDGLRNADSILQSICGGVLTNLHFHESKSKQRSAAIVPRLIHALSDPEPRIRIHAATILGDVGPDAEAAVPALIGLMGEEDEAPKPEEGANRSPFPWGPAAESAATLGRIAPGTPREAEAAEALIAVLRESTNALTRAKAAGALAAFDAEFHEPALPLLLSALKETMNHPDSPADAFCSVLGKTAPNTPWADEAVALLTVALESASPGVRSTAAESLARFGPRAKPALARLHAIANDERVEPWVRGPAGSAARRIEAVPDSTP